MWNVAKARPEVQQLTEELGISPLLAQVLCNRGMDNREKVSRFLYEDELYDPFLLEGMNVAVQRILAAIDSNEKIRVYGDYDVDGITAVTLLFETLSWLGGRVDYYIPERLDEGYGLNRDAVMAAVDSGIGLMITVDTGITALEEARLCSELGLDLIITDHHEALQELPVAIAALNPKFGYPFSGLAGVGVAYKLAEALIRASNREEAFLNGLLDLVALGTVADIVPLLDENRLLTQRGLLALKRNKRPGLEALAKVAGIELKDIDTGKVAFALAPRLNAVGRIGSADSAVKLLLSKSFEQAYPLAKELDVANRERQGVESRIVQEAEELLKEKVPDTVIALKSSQWHTGIVGIVASRILGKYYLPVFLGVEETDALGREIVKGSARSIEEFNIFSALEEMEDILLAYGGHARAAGFTLLRTNWEEFVFRLEELTKEAFAIKPPVPGISVDAVLKPENLDEKLIDELKYLEPYGMGNPKPVFLLKNVNLAWARRVGKTGEHLQAELGATAKSFKAIGFGLADFDVIPKGTDIELVGTPEFNYWQGKKEINFLFKDLRLANASEEVAVTRDTLYDWLEKAEDSVKKTYPDREALRRLYLVLQSLHKSGKAILHGEDLSLVGKQASLTEEQSAKAIDIFRELNLLVNMDMGKQSVWIFSPVESQIELQASQSYSQSEQAYVQIKEAVKLYEQGDLSSLLQLSTREPLASLLDSGAIARAIKTKK